MKKSLYFFVERGTIVISTKSSILAHRKWNMEKESLSKKISFLKTGWWIIHLLGITIVYTLGHILWK